MAPIQVYVILHRPSQMNAEFSEQLSKVESRQKCDACRRRRISTYPVKSSTGWNLVRRAKARRPSHLARLQ